jgi:hypothetical protein
MLIKFFDFCTKKQAVKVGFNLSNLFKQSKTRAFLLFCKDSREFFFVKGGNATVRKRVLN